MAWCNAKLIAPGGDCPAAGGGTRHARRVCRRAITVVEIGVATAMLAILLVAFSRMVVALSSHERAVERHQLALQTAHNLIERLENTDWEDLPLGQAASLEIPAEVRQMLPEAAATVEVTVEPAPVEARQLTVALEWSRRKGQPPARLRLHTWVFPPPTAPRSSLE